MQFITYSFLLLFTCVYGQQSALGLEQGEICKKRGKKTWTCEHLRNCPQIGDFKKKKPTICSFDGIEPIICCPPSTNSRNPTSSGNKGQLIASNGNANRKCRELLTKACPARKKRYASNTMIYRPFVVGGKSALPRVHTYMVLIGYGAANSKSWECGGSLISEMWVLSAAHCANPKSQGPAQWARVGDLDISSTTEDARPQEKRIVQRIVHPNYKDPAVYNDIALFKLNSAVLFNDWVAPIYLQTDRAIDATKATIIGWGRSGFVGDVSAQLQEVEMTLVDGEECRRLYNDSIDSKIPRGIEVEAMICAGEREGGKSACAGDSGGPLVIKAIKFCPKTQIGISSFGKECALPNTPGVYTRVSQYIPWIESIVWPN